MACMALFYKYFHNTKTGECEQFVYGGCGGNENRFNTKEDCEAYCIHKSTEKRLHQNRFNLENSYNLTDSLGMTILMNLSDNSKE